MTYLAILQKAPIRAAAVASGVTNLTQAVEECPETRRVLAETIHGFEGHETESLRERSVAQWGQEINVPALWTHLAQKLRRLSKTYQLDDFCQ